MDCPHLEKAPIIEAIIDIQCIVGLSPDQAETLNTLQSAHSKIISNYPKMTPQTMRRFTVPKNSKEIDVHDLTSGYIFKSEDGTKVVQFRVNGFTLSHLKPYKDWPTLINEAKQLWPTYSELFPQIIVKRLATRFINQVKVPYPLSQTNDYLTNIKNPLTEPHDVSLIRSFVEQTSSIEQHSEITVNFIRLMEQPALNTTEASVMLDIDVFKTVPDFQSNDPNMWQIIESFREVKNKIFFQAIGEKTIARYK